MQQANRADPALTEKHQERESQVAILLLNLFLMLFTMTVWGLAFWIMSHPEITNSVK